VVVMAGISGKIRRYIMYISFQERRKRALIRYKQEINRLQSMEVDELDLEYINMKSIYEHKKNVLSIFMLSIVISVLLNVWNYFYRFIEKIIQYTTSYQGNEIDIAKMVFILSVITVAFITIIIVVMLIIYLKRMHQTYKNVMIIEELRNRRND